MVLRRLGIKYCNSLSMGVSSESGKSSALGKQCLGLYSSSIAFTIKECFDYRTYANGFYAIYIERQIKTMDDFGEGIAIYFLPGRTLKNGVEQSCWKDVTNPLPDARQSLAIGIPRQSLGTREINLSAWDFSRFQLKPTLAMRQGF